MKWKRLIQSLRKLKRNELLVNENDKPAQFAKQKHLPQFAFRSSLSYSESNPLAKCETMTILCPNGLTSNEILGSYETYIMKRQAMLFHPNDVQSNRLIAARLKYNIWSSRTKSTIKKSKCMHMIHECCNRNKSFWSHCHPDAINVLTVEGHLTFVRQTIVSETKATIAQDKISS